MGNNTPFRLDFFDDEVENISVIDIKTQRSIKKVASIKILPAHEFPTDNEAINTFRKQYREEFNPHDLTLHNIYKTISEKSLPAGIEYYFPLFFENKETANIFDYLPSDTVVITTTNVVHATEDYYNEILDKANRYRSNLDHPSLSPQYLFLKPSIAAEYLNKYPLIRCYPNESVQTAPKDAKKTDSEAVPTVAFNHTLTDKLAPLTEFYNSYKGKILITVASNGRLEIMLEFLKPLVTPKILSSYEEFFNDDCKEKIAITIAPFVKGVKTSKYTIITETELLGYSYTSRKKRSTHNRNFNVDAVIKNLTELKIGEHIVHEQYGICEFIGLKTLVIDNVKGEYVSLKFQNEATMYVPITSLHLLSRYSGAPNPTLSKLGGDAWKKARKKATDKIRDVAANLLDIYAKRQIKQGFEYKVDKDEYAKFAAGFGYKPTEDQAKAINATLNDMRSSRPMDRLICGDVGFGKTEVAMRAAFVAIHNNKQVAILVPTTLLADQHYDNFRDRFANTAANIAVLSRFKSAKEQRETIADIASGKIDIIIGTHKLLSSTIKYKDLGLLIVDEEHRFGVRQKEQIKKLRSNVDILTMTATPIPRTLNMAMNSIRDLSIIATPPAKRLAVKTFVHELEDDLIKEAVLRELKRGGQCYYLHNDVESINRCADHIAEILPEAKIAVAHAQLPEKELEHIMHDFYHQRYNVLVTSTIIETGIDVPTANTIIIERADKLGLAQLHQLRGRVGRSHHQAYAFLLTPPANSLSEDSKKRLAAISNLEELGSGFILATQDLEIRGAGEILGSEQSGQIQTIGFSLYSEMLESAVKTLQAGNKLTDEDFYSKDINIELHAPILLPDNYIYDVNERLSIYKRISSCITKNELDELKAEIIDRFGTLPSEAQNLFIISNMKLICQKLGIDSINMNVKYGNIKFADKIHIKFEYLTGLFTSQPQIFKPDSQNKIKITKEIADKDERISFIQNLLNEMLENYEENI